ncbi:MAG: SAM-dependent DNA methyltransferase, partial [Chloroflexi bacterium]|nr:SAM-dependent DNA methyltransferase [Chloroflexota bacterium]
VDIDPRAVQIAGLSLWLRAQKSWQTKGLRLSERPQIRKSNVVCAEPMPGDRQMLDEFLSTLSGDGLETLMRKAWHVPTDQKVRATPQMADALAKLVRTVWQEMELAGEAGSLLKIEETLRDAIATARKESEEKSPLFRVLEYGLNEPPKEKYVQVVAGEDQDFFDQAEGLVLAALREYSEQAVNGDSYKRRLFAGDASQGFVFIDLCRKLYDIVVMNPPFGELSEIAQEYLTNKYPLTCNNIATIFVERMANKLNPMGGLALIIDNSTSIRSSYEDFRKTILYNSLCLYTYASLGWEVLDANVEVCAYSCFRTATEKGNCFCVDASKKETKENFLKENILSISQGKKNQFVIVNPEEFKFLPNAIPNFSMPRGIRSLFGKFPSVNNLAHLKTGMSSGDNERFYKMFWERPQRFENDWKFLSNGGEYSPYYRGDREIINWHRDGIEIKEHRKATFRNSQYYSRVGLSYSKRCEYLSVQLLPSGFAFTDEGQCIFPVSEENRYGLLAFFNSKFARVILNEYCGQHKSNGYVQLIPFPNINLSILGKISNNIVQILYSELIWTIPSIYSRGPLLLNPAIFETNLSINEIRSNLIRKWELSKVKIDEYENTLNMMIYESSGLNENEVNYINNKAKKIPAAHFQLSEQKTDGYSLVSEFLDYIMGVFFGYWNILSIKEPIEVPLDTAPIYPPGTVYKGKPLASNNIPDFYPVNVKWSGIAESQTPIEKESLPNKLEEILRIIWKEKLEGIELEISESLKISSMDEYFGNPDLFFKDHLKRYSKSRRAAPIYWPLSTPSCSYTLWLYYHRLNDQTLYTCVNDFVDPKLKQVSEEAARLRLKKGRSAADEKELERLTDFERELKDFREELLRVAKFWKPNLNDGVEITAAPLWKLFQHKPWQKRLKETWQKLEAGEYDWAHLAYSIWPERVREKCKNDKSLAIAHDLEELYVEPPASAKKKKAKKPAVDEETEGWFNDD